MIKNSGTATLLLALTLATPAAALSGCRNDHPHDGELQGLVELDERVLAFEVPGQVQQLLVHRGDRVTPTQLLAALDDTLERTTRETRRAEAAAAAAQAELAQAGSRPEEVRALAAQLRSGEAALANLRATLARERRLHGSGVTPAAIVDDLAAREQSASADLEAQRQRLQLARRGARPQEIRGAEARADAARHTVTLLDERLDRHQLRAPVEATVVDTHVDPGEIVGAGSPVLTLADTSHPYADVFVPQGALGGVRLGSPAVVRVDAQPAPLTGRVEWISHQTEFTPRFLFSQRERPNLVVRVRVRIDDPGELLHAGVPAFVTITRSATPQPAAQAQR